MTFNLFSRSSDQPSSGPTHELSESERAYKERYDDLYETYGHYAVIGPLEMPDLRKLITEMSDMGWDLKSVYPSHPPTHTAYLVYNYER